MDDGARCPLRFDRFTLDLARGCLREGAREIVLRPKAYEVLRYLAERADRLVSKDEIIAAVWPKIFVTDDSLVHCVTELRQVLGDREQKIIRTVPRRGYRFVARVAAPRDGAPGVGAAEDLGGTGPSGRFRPLGAVSAVSVLVVLMVLGVAGWWWQIRRGPSEAHGPLLPDRPSIAVLPFDDLDGGERQRRLAQGFAEDVIVELARSPELLVIAQNSSFAYAGKPFDVRRIGAELGVRYLLEGSFRTGPDRLKVSVQLIDATTGAHAWSERYDRPLGDLFAVRDEVLTRLVGTLNGYDGPIWAAWQTRARSKPPQSLGAWDYFLLARAPYRRHDKEGNAEARELLLRAVELDPGFARAWCFIAHTYTQDWINGWAGDRARSLALKRDAAERAAALDPGDGFIQATLAESYFADDQVELGRQAWERALALSPNDALVNRMVGTQLPLALGVERAADGVRLVERALYTLDPLHPLFQYLSLGIPLYFAGRYADAIEALSKVPAPWLEVRVMLALSYGEARLSEQAQRQVEQILGLEPGFSAEAWVDNDFYQPGGSSAALFFDGARKAGLPLCAAPDTAAKLDPGNLLPDCEAERARKAALPAGVVR